MTHRDHVSYEEMAARATRLANARNDIESQLRRLEDEVQRLVEGGFISQKVASRFRSSYEEFHRGATHCLRGLEAMSSILTGSAESMSESGHQLVR